MAGPLRTCSYEHTQRAGLDEYEQGLAGKERLPVRAGATLYASVSPDRHGFVLQSGRVSALLWPHFEYRSRQPMSITASSGLKPMRNRSMTEMLTSC